MGSSPMYGSAARLGAKNYARQMSGTSILSSVDSYGFDIHEKLRGERMICPEPWALKLRGRVCHCISQALSIIRDRKSFCWRILKIFVVNMLRNRDVNMSKRAGGCFVLHSVEVIELTVGGGRPKWSEFSVASFRIMIIATEGK